MGDIRLSAVISVHNEEAQLAECLEGLSFADEIVVLLDKCTDGSGDIARTFTDRVIDGAWAVEGDRRNAGIDACRGQWIFEIDADERVPDALGQEIRALISSTSFDWHEILEASEREFLMPDLVLLLDIDPANGLLRVKQRGGIAEPAFEDPSFLDGVAAIYAAIDRPYIERIDASGDSDTVAAQVRDAVARRIDGLL